MFTELRGGVGVFTGRGGTIGTLVAATIALVVDTQFPDSVGPCFDGVKARAGREADLVINTHHHGDHTAGNVTARQRGIRRIVAHERVPDLQRAWAATRNPPPAIEVPNETFSQRWRLDTGDEVISAEHLGPAHTGGDIIVRFEKANVVHMGDLVFHRLIPVIDRPAGASIAGWIRLLEDVAQRYPADAVYIFGHGRDGVTGERVDLLLMRDYLARLLETVGADIKAGRTLEQVKERKALDGFADYGGGNRLPVNLETAFAELTATGK
jgi:cyclase